MIHNRTAYLIFTAALGAALCFCGDADAQLFGRRAARKAARQVNIPASVPRTQCVDADGDGLDDRTGQPCGGQGPVTREEFGTYAGAYVDPATGVATSTGTGTATPRTIRKHVDSDGDGFCDGCGEAVSAAAGVSVTSLDEALAAENAAKQALAAAVKARKLAAIQRDSELQKRRIELEAKRQMDALERGDELEDVHAQQRSVQSLEPTLAETESGPDDCEDCELGKDE